MSARAGRLTPSALVLVLLTVLVRLLVIQDARFTGDESYFWAVARNIATFQAAPLYGPPMTGSNANHPGPLFYYLMAVPQRLGTSPLLGSGFVALLHGLGALCFYQIARAARGERAGLVALSLLAFAPWDVLYADRIWLSCVAPVWGTVTVYAAHRAPAGARWQAALVFLALVCPQLHMSAPIIWTVVAVLVMARPPQRWRPAALALGAGLAVLAYAPAIWGELTHDFANTRAILAEGGGHTAGLERAAAPLRVLGYAALYGTSEIGYHFARGYWTPFDEAALYFDPRGWARYLELHGAWAIANVVSIAVALAAWGAMTAALVRSLRAPSGAGRGLLLRLNALDLDATLMLGLWAGLVTGAVLLFTARKPYFPHYTNLLMPLALWPVVSALDRVLGLGALRGGMRGRPRRALLGAAALAVIVAGMLSSVVRYYRRVDALNGLAATLEMVDAAAQESTPIDVQFEGFGNGFAWQMVTNVAYHRELAIRPGAPVRYRVKNGALWDGEPPPGTRRFGAVLVERSPPWSPGGDASSPAAAALPVPAIRGQPGA